MLSYAELQAELRALTVQDSSVKLRIPVHEGSDILYQTKHSPLAFYTGLDSGQYRGLYNTRPYVRHLLGFYPTEVIRQRDADTFYFVYDTDGGIQSSMGFPLLISKMLSHADFAGIQAGDSAEKIRAIDPVMSVYEDMFFNVYQWNSIASESKRKENDPRRHHPLPARRAVEDRIRHRGRQ